VALDIFRDVAVMLDDAIIDEVHKKFITGDTSDKGKDSLKTPARKEIKVWMIPANEKYFNIASCVEKYGEIYWAQYYNFLKGDTGYIYNSSPDSAIRYKFIIEDEDLPYNSKMDQEIELYINPNDFDGPKRA